jgi:hypothetical protein
MKKMPIYDLAVRWPDGKQSLQRIIKLGGLPLYGRPKYLKIPDGKVAIVQHGGEISLLFSAKSIDGPRKVKVADGTFEDQGYLVRAKTGTLKKPKGKEPRRLGIKWRGFGQIRYFDATSGRSVLIDDSFDNSDKEYMDDNKEVIPGGYHARPYSGGIPGLTKNHPEAKLVDEYVEWMNRPGSFEHPYLQAGRLYTDLFDRRYWRLIEAKTEIDRFTLRTAVGQLLDYKRFFSRKPALGVLLPSRPSESSLEYLTECHVTALWRTPTGRFSDLSQGTSWTARER